MLQVMRERIMGWLGWVIIGLIIITFALFGLGSYLQDKTRVYAARVNDVEVSVRDLQLAYQQQRERLGQMLGENFNPALIDDQMLKQRALDGLVNQTLLLQAAQSSGVVISDPLLAATIHSVSAFQQDGEFSEELYRSFLQQRGATSAEFEQDVRRSLASEQLVNGLTQTVFVTPADVERVYKLQDQTRDFAYVIVPAKNFSKDVAVSDEQIASYYNEHGDEFMVPERVRLEYVRLDGKRLEETIEIADSDLEEYYEQRKESLHTLEQRQASHILIQVPADADEATVNKAKAEADALLARIRAGEDFGALAKKHSDDPGSADTGGDLGFFSKGAMVPEFEASVFSLEEGEISEPVRSQFGFHIIKLTGIRGSEIPPLEQVRDELTAELRKNRVSDIFYGQLEQLTDLSYEHPESLTEAASALGLEIQTSDWLSAGGGPGIGQYPPLVAAAFSDDVLEGGNNSEPVEVGENDVIVARVAEREAEHRAPLADVTDRIRNILAAQQAAQKAQAKGEALLDKLEQGVSMGELKSDGFSVAKAEGVKRSATGHPPEILNAAFRLEKPAPDSSVDRGLTLSNGDYAVLRLTAVTDGNAAAMDAQTREQLVRGFENMRRSVVMASTIENLRARADIVIPQDSE